MIRIKSKSFRRSSYKNLDLKTIQNIELTTNTYNFLIFFQSIHTEADSHSVEYRICNMSDMSDKNFNQSNFIYHIHIYSTIIQYKDV